MKYPKFLKKNNTIGIIAPSGGSDDENKKTKYLNAKKFFESNGYKIELSKNIFNNYNGRSASKEERGHEVNEVFSNSNIDFILCATGGDFLVECLDYVDYDLIKNNPKYIAGFSDPTGLLYSITTKCDIATIYGQNLSPFGSDRLYKCHSDFVDIISGKKLEENSYDLYEEERLPKVTGLEGYNLTEKVIYKTLDNKDVNVIGRIIGGCFDIINELAGTPYDGFNSFCDKYKDDGIIWYFDNCEESLEETIRILWKFNALGYFKYAKCIIFGRFGTIKTSYDYDVKSCLEDSILSSLNIPVVYDADISHKSPCLTIINGSIANISVKDGKCNINFELK